MTRLATPIVLAELGWMGMGIVDTMMVGRVGADAIAAVGLGAMMFYGNRHAFFNVFNNGGIGILRQNLIGPGFCNHINIVNTKPFFHITFNRILDAAVHAIDGAGKRK